MIMERMHLLFKEFGRELGMPEMKLDAKGVCTIVIEDKVKIVFNVVDELGVMVVYAELGLIPDDRRAEIHAAMLKGNFGWEKTRGSTLSAAGEGAHASLHAYLTWDQLDLPGLLTFAEHFFHRASVWSAYIAGQVDHVSDPGESVAPR